jgi:hypothetical protein
MSHLLKRLIERLVWICGADLPGRDLARAVERGYFPAAMTLRVMSRSVIIPTRMLSLSTTGTEPASSCSMMCAASTTESFRLTARGFTVIASRTVVATLDY